MESRWVYREVERLLDHDIAGPVLPHTEISRKLRHDVAEIKDISNIRSTSYLALAVWAAAMKNQETVDNVNGASARFLDTIPYIARGRKKESNKNKAGSDPPKNDMSIGEALMREFMEEDKARKERGEPPRRLTKRKGSYKRQSGVELAKNTGNLKSGTIR